VRKIKLVSICNNFCSRERKRSKKKKNLDHKVDFIDCFFPPFFTFRYLLKEREIEREGVNDNTNFTFMNIKKTVCHDMNKTHYRMTVQRPALKEIV